MKFINRESELNKLNELWAVKSAQLVIVYGKRRVGKTELIKQFIRDGKGIYFLAGKRSHQDQLKEFARVVGNYFNDDFTVQRSFEDWLEAFIYIKGKVKDDQIVISVDEYPYLAESDSSVSSIFQKIWDEHLKESNIYLILCGSSMSMMESELIAYKAPLYGRATGKLLIEPMNFISSMKFFPKKPFQKFLSFYSLTGGMPAYMKQFSRYNSVIKAIENLCWDKQGLYHNEVNAALSQELRTPNYYYAILKAVSMGKTRVSEIASASGLNVQLVNKYLDTLERLQFIKREVPVTEEKPHKSKKGIYILTENFVKFWFQYIFAFSSDLEIGNINHAKNRFLHYSHILEAGAYEQIAREHLRILASDIFPVHRVGRYWNRSTEIDGITLNLESKQAIFMEAKWTNAKLGLRELKQLKKKISSVDWNKNDRQEYYALYSKSGFEKELIDLAKIRKEVILVEGILRI